jgi:DNA-binding response OmpR family regulator
VPASRQSSTRTVLQPGVILLEEYDALAAAIGAALKKFAPRHAFSVGRSLAEAKKIAADLKPELFLIDTDPPWAGITDFLEELRSALPEARALVIGAPIPTEIVAARGSLGALQFIEKPFELAAFGAAVQALLGPWHESESAARGVLRDLGVADIVLLHCAAKANVIVEVRSGAKNFGEIHIVGGEVFHAKTRKLTGEDALLEIVGWRNARMSEEDAVAPTGRTIGREWPAILLDALCAIQPPAPPRVSPAETIPKVKTGKKIVVVDDTEMLLIFVEDTLSTADPELQITTALSGDDGVQEIGRVIPDLVLLDYSLPDFNGDEVCRRLLQDKRTVNVPILMMSGHVPQMAATAAIFPNVVATIEKPFLSDALVDLVRRTLAGERKPKAAPRSHPVPAPIVPPQRTAMLPETEIKPLPTPQPIPPLPPIPSPMPTLVGGAEQGAPRPKVRVTSDNDAVLGLFLEVVSMQLTPQLQMGTIRAKTASPTVSLHLSSAVRDRMPAQIGFQLGNAELDGNGRLSILRLIPTARPFQPAQTRNAFEIGGVSLIPNAVKTRVQLTPSGSTPMTIELLAHLELAAVELNPTFQVAQLVLKWPTNIVRVTLNPKAPEQTAARFEASAMKLDAAGRLAELVLNPIK